MEQISKHELESWIERLQSMPIEIILSDDESFPYEMDKFSILRLENGKFATILEQACCCYDSNEAIIEILPSEDSCREQHKKWLSVIAGRKSY